MASPPTFAQLDKAGDGKVDEDEFKRGGAGDAALFARLDTNGDGFVDEDEYEFYDQAFQEDAAEGDFWEKISFQPRAMPAQGFETGAFARYCVFLLLFLSITVNRSGDMYNLADTTRMAVRFPEFTRVTSQSEYYEWLSTHFFPGVSSKGVYKGADTSIGIVGVPRIRQVRDSATAAVWGGGGAARPDCVWNVPPRCVRRNAPTSQCCSLISTATTTTRTPTPTGPCRAACQTLPSCTPKRP